MVKCETMEIIYEARRQRLAQLIEERFGGSQTSFAAFIGVPSTNVNGRLYHTRPYATSIAPRRNIGERLARSIEEKLQLPHYWLDGLDLGRRNKPRAPVSRAAERTPKIQTKGPTERRTSKPERRVNGDRRQAELNEAA